jgi:hypothetical protein
MYKTKWRIISALSICANKQILSQTQTQVAFSHKTGGFHLCDFHRVPNCTGNWEEFLKMVGGKNRLMFMRFKKVTIGRNGGAGRK